MTTKHAKPTPAPTPGPALAITMLVKNRATVLRYALECLAALAEPKQSTAVLFIDDASTDGASELLAAYVRRYGKEYQSIGIATRTEANDTNTSSRDGLKDRGAGYPHLAELRNDALAWVREQKPDHWLDVDSDVLVPVDIVARLRAHARPYVSAMISNCGVTAPWPPGISNATNFGREKITRLTPAPGVTLMECDVTGAVALADKRAITARVAFAAHDYGEQVPFCMDLCHAGYRPAVDCRPGCIHAMDPSQLSVALGKFVEANGYAPGGTKPAPDALPPFAIIIPQREDKTQPLRERNRKWVTAYWKAQVPEATVVAGIDPGPGDFNRARARNAGAAAAPANTEVFVFADADGIVGPEHLRQAVRIAAAGMPASPACWLEILLDEEAAAVCAGDPSVAPGIRKDPCRGVCGLDYYLINAISRKQFAEVGGYDERFADYGGEDLSLAAVVRTLLGGPASVDAHAYHLQHETPIGGREQLTPATEAHQARYRAAEGDAAAMRALIVGKPFPEPARWEKVRGGWLTFPPTEPDTVVAEYLASADGGAYHHLSLAGAFVPGTVLLDAGAHAGSETVRALRAGAAHVYAVEPHPVHLTHLRRNIEEMGAEDGPGRVTVIPKALGAKAATAAGFTYDGGGSHLDPAGTTTVAVVRGDTLALDPAPTLYKFDIEGAEEDALRGLADTIRSTSPRPGIILCLYHRPGDVERLPALLAEIDPRYGEPTEANSTCAYWARGDA